MADARHGLSEEARAFLATPASPTDYPEPGDIDGWLGHIRRTNTIVAGFLKVENSAAESTVRDIGGVSTAVISPPGTDPDRGPVVLHFHAGGLIYFGGELAGATSAADALTYRATTWAPDYRMPPTHPYPAALDDAIAVYTALLLERGPSEIVVAGGSAGGNIAAALLVRAHDEGLPMPAAAILMTPEVDLTESGDTFSTHRDLDNTLSSLAVVNRLYASGADLTDPYLSPLFADVSNYPPTYLQSGTRDLFLSNTVRMHRRLREAGVEAELHVFEGRPHAGFFGAPEHTEPESEIRRFLDRHLGS